MKKRIDHIGRIRTDAHCAVFSEEATNRRAFFSADLCLAFIEQSIFHFTLWEHSCAQIYPSCLACSIDRNSIYVLPIFWTISLIFQFSLSWHCTSSENCMFSFYILRSSVSHTFIIGTKHSLFSFVLRLSITWDIVLRDMCRSGGSSTDDRSDIRRKWAHHHLVSGCPWA